MRSQEEPLGNRACTHRSVFRHSMAGRFSLPQPQHRVRLCCDYTKNSPRPKAGGVSYLRKVWRIQVFGALLCKRSVRMERRPAPSLCGAQKRPHSDYTAFPVTLRDKRGRIKDRRVCLRQRPRRSPKAHGGFAPPTWFPLLAPRLVDYALSRL